MSFLILGQPSSSDVTLRNVSLINALAHGPTEPQMENEAGMKDYPACSHMALYFVTFRASSLDNTLFVRSSFKG